MSEQVDLKQHPVPPTSLGRRFVRAIVGFGVGVVVGCAPFLGAAYIPSFSPLLSVFPIDLRPTLVPLGGFLVGLIAAGTQFYSGISILTINFKKWAKWSLVISLLALVLLLIGYRLLVRQVHYREDFIVSVVTGIERTSTCPCPTSMPDSMCLRTLSANPDNVEVCWGRGQVALSEILLSFFYLLLIGSFCYLISLILLQEDKKKKLTKSHMRTKRKLS